jgi:hypothetical protein
MTVTVPPPEPPVAPGMAPHPAASDAHATRAPVDSRRLLPVPGEGRRRVVSNPLRVRRLPVMLTHDSVTLLTHVSPLVNKR